MSRSTLSNTIVIASTSPTAGGAGWWLRPNWTRKGLIGGVAVSEPAIEMPANPGVVVRRGANTIAITGKTLVDFTTVANLYQACASLAPSVTTGPYAVTLMWPVRVGVAFPGGAQPAAPR